MSEKPAENPLFRKPPILTCRLCVWYLSISGAWGFCRRLNEILTFNYAPICLLYSYRTEVSVSNLLNPHPISGSVGRTWHLARSEDDVYAVLRLEDASVYDPRDINEKGTIIHFSKTATGDIKAPAATKSLEVLAWYYHCTTDIVTELRFKTSGNVIAALPAKGACGMNLIGRKRPQGAVNEIVEIYLSSTGTVKGWLNYNEV